MLPKKKIRNAQILPEKGYCRQRSTRKSTVNWNLTYYFPNGISLAYNLIVIIAIS